MDREYQEATGFRVGFKPAGGIRTAKDAIAWLVLIKVRLFCMVICVSLYLSLSLSLCLSSCFFVCFAGGIMTAMDTICVACPSFYHHLYIKMFTFTFLNLLFSGGTWGLLAEQQDVQVIPTVMTSSQHFMHVENNYIHVVFHWFVFE